jgi:hypothetical protein
MKKLEFTIVLLLAIIIGGCTENQRARSFGGNEEISIKANEKLINVTWKGDNMWVLTEDTITHVKYFRESSSFGVWEGQITIK